VSRAVNVLGHVERRQQVREAASVRIIDVLCVDVEIPSDDDRARVHDQVASTYVVL